MRGFVNILKPSGMTSSDVVVKVRGILRRVTGEKHKVGHLGTLDPIGTGVLPIAIGTATRLFDVMLTKEKVYNTTFRFSETTDTLDSTGKVTESGGRIPTYEEIESVLGLFVGEIEQTPPAYSAKSVDGKRAYEYAREGKTVELKPKKVFIRSIKLISNKEGNYIRKGEVINLAKDEFAFEIVCGGGTYVRSIARDIAAALETFAYMSSINRVESGCFIEAEGVNLIEFENNPLDYIIPIEQILTDYPSYELTDEYADKILNGVKLKLQGLPNDVFTVKTHGKTVGLAKNADDTLNFIVRL